MKFSAICERILSLKTRKRARPAFRRARRGSFYEFLKKFQLFLVLVIVILAAASAAFFVVRIQRRRFVCILVFFHHAAEFLEYFVQKFVVFHGNKFLFSLFADNLQNGNFILFRFLVLVCGLKKSIPSPDSFHSSC